MALDLYNRLEREHRDSDDSRHSLDDPSHFSVGEDDRLNELDPLHSATFSSTFDYDEEVPARSKQSRNGSFLTRKRPLGFLARKQARDEKVKKLKRTFLVPGRLCIIVALVIATIGFAVVGGGGYWIYKQEPINGLSPPVYPTPKGGTVKKWEESYRKAALMVANMTLLEKVNVTTGIGWMMGPCVGNTGSAPGVGFPALCLQDGPLGVRFADHITATPAGVTVGATWNKDLMYKRGKLLGLENRLKGVHVHLGPCVGPLGKIPAGGRNWEGFGSDPVLQGWAAAQTIKGVQEEGVIATIKHFIGNEQEHYRQKWEWGIPNAISSNIDDRTLHELYAWPFADSVRAGVASVMCSYNQVNNSHACQNSKLMNGILKDELGFQGFVQSDWLAQHSGVASALAGLDMSMPGDGAGWADGISFWGPKLTLAALNGSLPMERLDDMVTRVVAAWYQLGQDDEVKWPAPSPDGEGGPNFFSWTKDRVGLIHPGSDDKSTAVVNQFVDVQRMGGYSHSGLVRRIAAEGTVLLKNEGNILPLSRNGLPQSATDSPGGNRKYKVAIFGEDSAIAKGGPNVCPDRRCNEGTLASGWGSGAVDFGYLVSPVESLQHGFHNDSVDVVAFTTNDLPSQLRNTGIEEQDLCIVFANADSGEGHVVLEGVDGDRNDLNLQKGGDLLIRDVAANCGRNRGTSSPGAGNGSTVVVIHSVGPVLLESFIEDPNVRAVVYASLPGQESGHALADVLFGDYNPSGRLPYTIGKSLQDYGPGSQVLSFPNGIVPQQDFTEGLLVDYRWFDAKNITPRYPFGYGLSYTHFDLNDLVIAIPEGMTRPDPLPAARPEAEVNPPQYTSPVPAIKDLLFPAGWRKLHKYVYPYLESPDVTQDVDYPYPDMTPQTPSAAGGGEGGNPALWDVLVNVDVTVTNTGARDGQTVVQLYIVFPDDVEEEVWEDEQSIGDQDVGLGEDFDAVQIEDLETRQLDGEVGKEDLARMDVPVQEDSRLEDATPEEKSNTVAKPEETELEQPTEDKSTFEQSQPVQPTDENPTTPGSSPFEAAQPQDQTQPPDAEHPTSSTQPPTQNPPTSPQTHQTQPQPPVVIARERITFPPRVLRAFEKVNTYTTRNGDVAAQDTQVIKFQLTRRDLSYWSVRKQNWVIPDGSFGIEVGFSSRDLRLRGTVF